MLEIKFQNDFNEIQASDFEIRESKLERNSYFSIAKTFLKP